MPRPVPCTSNYGTAVCIHHTHLGTQSSVGLVGHHADSRIAGAVGPAGLVGVEGVPQRRFDGFDPPLPVGALVVILVYCGSIVLL